MKRRIILSALAAMAAFAPNGVVAAINGVDAKAYFERGVAMYNDRNYNGCIDQMLQLRNLTPTVAEQQDAFYYIAMATLYSGDDEALDLLQRFLNQFPQSVRCADVTMAMGDYHFTRGIHSDALKIYAGINHDGLTQGRVEELEYRQAYCHMMLGENANALLCFDRLKESKTYGNAALFYKAYIAYQEKDYESARKLFAQVDQSQEPGESSRYYICQLDFQDGQYVKALKEAEALLAEAEMPEFAPELNRIAGESLYNTGQTARAIGYLKKYVSTSENVRPSAYYMLGTSEFQQKNYSLAIPMLQMATSQEDVTAQSAYLYLGQAYVKTGETDAAILAFEKASRMSYDERITEVATYNYIAARRDGGRVPFGKTVEMMESFLIKYPNSIYADNVREGLVGGYLTESDYTNALRIIKDIPQPSEKIMQAKQKALLALGSRTFQNGNPTKALVYLNEGVAIQPGVPSLTSQCHLWAADCYYELEDYDQAAAEYLLFLEKTSSSDDNAIHARYNLGYARMYQQRYSDAVIDFTSVASSYTATAQVRADAINRIGDCLYCQSRFSEAAQYYKRAYEAYPQAGDYALFQQAEMAGLKRDYNARLDFLDRMLDEFPSSALVPDAYIAKAETFNVLQRTEDAILALQQVKDTYPATAQARKASLSLAVTLLNNEKREEAIDAYQYVVSTYPTSEEAHVALDDLKNIYAEDGMLPDYVLFVNSVKNAQTVDISEFEATAFATAEEQYLTNNDVSRLSDYVVQFPDGVNMPKALLYIADEAFVRGDKEKALSYASRVVKEYPDASQTELALAIKADCEVALGMGELALASYKLLSQKASTPELLRDARVGVMQTAIDLNRYEDVLEATGQLLASSAANTETDNVQFFRALALDRLGRADEAYELWLPLSKDPATLAGTKSAVYMIESLVAAGNDVRAEKVANDFIDAGSPHNYWYARGFIIYSDILRRQGKVFEADEYLKALKSNYPDSDPDIFEMIESRLEQ